MLVVLTSLFSFRSCSWAGVRVRGHHDKENDLGEGATVRGEAVQLGSHDGQKDHMLGLSGTFPYAVFVYLCICVFVFMYLRVLHM